MAPSGNPIIDLVRPRLNPGGALRPGQESALVEYFRESKARPNIAIHLPTGYGKTLVGLGVAEYRRQVLKEKPVWLCPTRQLVFQVVERAKEMKIQAYSFVGTLGGADAAQKRNYNQWQIGNAIAVTVYERVFTRAIQMDHPDAASQINFDQATFAVLDDVHAAEQAVSAYWTLTLPRFLRLSRRSDQREVGDPFRNPAYFELLRVLSAFLPKRIRDYDFRRADTYMGTEKLQYDGAPVYCIPFPVLADRVELIKGAISRFLFWKNLKGLTADFPGFSPDHYDPLFFQRQVWDNIKDRLYFFHVLISRNGITLRPYICPVGEHPIWTNVRNRLFMSATMKVDGEIQKLFGTEDIFHVGQTVDVVAATGRRMHLGLDPQSKISDGRNHMDAALSYVDRLICITPGEFDWKDLNEKAPSIGQKAIFEASETETSRDQFLAHRSAVLKYYGRYEGLDVPNEQCRSVLLYRLPDGLSLLEKFLTYEIGCQDLIQGRIASRIEQGLGRCNRKPEDTSLILLDQDLLTWVLNRQELFSDFVMEELRFCLGIPEIENPVAFVDRFVNQPAFRSEFVDRHNRAIVDRSRQVSVGSSAPDGRVWKDELRFASRFWRKEFGEAHDHAMRIVPFYGEAAEQAQSNGESRKADGFWRLAAWWGYLAGITRACSDRPAGSPFDYTGALVRWNEAVHNLERGNTEEERLEWWRHDLINAPRMVGRGVLDKALANPLPTEGSIDHVCLQRQVVAFQEALRSKQFLLKFGRIRTLLGLDELAPLRGQEASRRFEEGIESVGSLLGFVTRSAAPNGADGVWLAKSPDDLKNRTVIVFEAKTSEQGKKTDPVKRDSLQQLDAWKFLVTEKEKLTGDEELFLVRVGRQQAVNVPEQTPDEQTMYANLADGKSIILVDDFHAFVEALFITFEETYALCMKCPTLEQDVQRLSSCLHFLGTERGARASDFIGLLRNKIFTIARGA